MIIRALDASGDWQFGKGKNDFRRGFAALSQDIRTRLLSFLGDCFFDLGAGVDWFNLLGGKDRQALELAIATVILNTNNVTGLQVLSIDESPGRRITISYRVTTVFGEGSDEFIFDNEEI